MSSAPEYNEVVIARKIRGVLDEGTAQISDASLARLAAARRMALARKKPALATELALAPAAAGAAAFGFGPLSTGRTNTPRRRRALLQLWLPLLLLAMALFGIAHWEEQKRVAELATLDAAVLSDALPLDAYVDHGFNEYLARNRP